MAIRKYTVYVNKEINRFEAILDAASIFVKIKSEKIEDGKYILEGSLDVIETLVKNFANGTMAITSSDREYSSAIVKMDNVTININENEDAEKDDVVSIVNHLNKIGEPEWVLIRLYNEEED